MSVAARIGNGLEGTLDMGENIRYQYPLPEDGMTIKICVQDGKVVLYASTRVTTPNSALYEYKLDISGRSSGTEVCDDVFVKSSESKKRNVVPESSNITLYVALNGEEQSNTFALNSTIGDTTSGKGTVETITVGRWMHDLLCSVFLCRCFIRDQDTMESTNFGSCHCTGDQSICLVGVF